MEPSSEIKSELESFRERWRAEVRAKKEPANLSSASGSAGETGTSSATATASASGAAKPGPSKPPGSSFKNPQVHHDHDDDGYEHNLDHPSETGTYLTGQGHTVANKEPVTALEHYEAAVEKEAQGSLGESVNLYRRAFKMDDAVDKKYKAKHFPTVAPPSAIKSTAQASTSKQSSNAGPGTTTTTAAITAQPSTQTQPAPSLPITELLASFAHLSIEGLPPPIENTPAPPCPIASLPDELLAHILRDVAVSDVGDFVRLALVCRRLAYLVATEEPVWRRVCEGNEWGFGAMKRQWERKVDWSPLDEDLTLKQRAPSSESGPGGIPKSIYEHYGSWKSTFRLRPRVRFNGVYISTVNYIRTGSNAGVDAAHAGPGGRSARNLTWNNPVHIVTYYRYLRFFRDGTVLSLLTTFEPREVVHHLTREEALAARTEGGRRGRLGISGAPGGGAIVGVDIGVGPSQGFMKYLLRGRWRLGKGEDQEAVEDEKDESQAAAVGPAQAGAANQQQGQAGPAPEQDDEAEDNLYVETEGVGKYIYRLDFALRGGGARSGDGRGNALGNNSKKLVWKGFYSYNTLTDDWGEFGLKNDKPFFFSRVKSYGRGE